MKLSIIRSKRGKIKSSNVRGYKYDTVTKELIIGFNDGSEYIYYDVDLDEFKKIADGDAECRTEGENEYGRWWVGKTPSIGAAVYKYLIEKNKKYNELSMQLKKIDKDKLPTYEIVVDENDETGINLISLVENPAIETKGMYFNDRSELMFKKVEDEQIIVGPALIPDMKIYREDKKIGPYFVVFTKETIKKMVEKFNRSGSNRRINFEHTDNMVNAFIMEDWIIESETYDKSRKYGFELPVGTYMIKVKIDDKRFWEEEVKGNGRFGFSIEGILGQSLVELSNQMSIEEAIDSLTLEDLLEIFDIKKS